ncbi:MAG: hypothetical protein BGN85_10880 [Alphaproteobacteria bacterium 64-11]|nr:MAG: hypothetical protein BGN85_10880 [Alphaproteobacteria bacterium 64-11]
MGFMAHWYHVATQNPYDTVWTGIGFLGQAVFGVRFLIQWLRSEQEGRSVIPIAFWYCSLVGGLASFSYVVHQGAWPLVIGQGLPLPIYARNIWLIHRAHAKVSPAT